MSRDLPYFKFYTSEWLNGDVTLLEMELQGMFINACAYYWHKECDLQYKQLQRKFGPEVNALIKEGLIVLNENETISIRFLDEQYNEFSDRKKKLSDAGKKGALLKASKKDVITTLQPPLINPLTIREEEDKENIIEEDIRKVLMCNLTDDSTLLNNEYHKKAFVWFKLFKTNTIESGITNTTTIDKARLSIWSADVKRMVEIDKRTSDEMNAVYKFLQVNEFWKKNIRSVSKLREKFEQLYLEANGKKNGSKINTASSSARTTQAGRQDFD